MDAEARFFGRALSWVKEYATEMAEQDPSKRDQLQRLVETVTAALEHQGFTPDGPAGDALAAGRLANAFSAWFAAQERDPGTVPIEELDRLWRAVLQSHEEWRLSQ